MLIRFLTYSLANLEKEEGLAFGARREQLKSNKSFVS